MWYKYPAVIIMFYLLALLQASFFAHFAFFGAFPNLVFIFLFLLIFFGGKKMKTSSIIYAIFAGIILDIFSGAILGFSAVLLIALGFASKKIQTSLNEKEDSYPFSYFLPLFLICLLAYEILLAAYLKDLDFGFTFWAGLAYNALWAAVGYYIYRKLNVQKIQSKKFGL